MTRKFLHGVAAIRPSGRMVGEDAALLTLPAGSTEIDVSTLSP